MASPIVQALDAEHDRIGRVTIDKYLNIPGHPNAYLIGDSACCVAGGGEPLGATAQVVVQQAPNVADNIYASLTGGERRPFKYRHRGDLVAVGRRSGVADVFGRRMTGVLAWLMWKMVYLSKLPGMRNRIQVALAWLLEPTVRVNTSCIEM
jgi:NADH dehydrogenase